MITTLFNVTSLVLLLAWFCGASLLLYVHYWTFVTWPKCQCSQMIHLLMLQKLCRTSMIIKTLSYRLAHGRTLGRFPSWNCFKVLSQAFIFQAQSCSGLQIPLNMLMSKRSRFWLKLETIVTTTARLCTTLTIQRNVFALTLLHMLSLKWATQIYEKPTTMEVSSKMMNTNQIWRITLSS